jgi:hypothetical protein
MGKFSFVVTFLIISIANLHSSIVNAQAIFESITIRESELVVHIECTIRAGNTCNGLRIMRSTDGIHFNQIGAVTGICGDERISVRYNFTDEKPLLNSFNYYQIEPGGFEVSETVSIYVSDLKGKTILLFPNPAQEYLNILLLQELVPNHSIQISNMNGICIYRRNILNSKTELDISHLLPGIYTVHVYDSHQRVIARNKFAKY